MRPRALDLYCGAGGVSRGLERAGFEVLGVDIKPQPRYPFAFVQADALAFLESMSWAELTAYAFVHASPPCQAHSVLRRANPGVEYPDLIAPTREALELTGLPWSMENVPGAPLRYSVTLCGTSFGLGALSGGGVSAERKWRELRRHRHFEVSWPVLAPPCHHQHESLGVYGGGPVGRYTFGNLAAVDPTARRGGYQGTAPEKAAAMGLEGLTRDEINQAIPPAYAEWLGRRALEWIAARRAEQSVVV